MINKNITDFNPDLKERIIKDYQKTHTLKKVEHRYNLTHNECLAILLDGGISDVELRHIVSATNIFSESFIVISDTHVGSYNENIEYLNEVYDFAIKNGIKHIFHAGDLLQSNIRPVNKKFMNQEIQAEHLVNVYPEDSQIINHILLGNHDFHAISKKEEVYKIISSRKDFDIMGYKRAYFTWNNYLLNLSHDIEKYRLKIPNVETLLRFVGHRHNTHVVGDSTIFAPTLSDDVKFYGGPSMPGFLVVTTDANRLKVSYMAFIDNNLEFAGVVMSKKLTRKYRI